MTTQGTHWDGCWKEHQACAWAEVERLRAERDALAAEQAQKIERLREEVMHLKRMEQHGIAVRRALLDECDSLRQDLAATLAERDAYARAMAQMNAPAIAIAAMQPPPPIIMPARDWELHQQIQTLNERLAYVEPIVVAARNLVDNAEEYECDGLGLWAQHGWWEPLHDALDPDGSEAADDIRQPVAPAK